MAYSYVSYTGNGSTQNYTLPFSYINRSDIQVTVNGVTTAFTWINASAIQISPAPVSDSAVQIRRVTQKATVPVNFSDGSTLLESDLDTLVQYVLYVSQEQADFPPDSAVAAAAASASAGAAAASAVSAAASAASATTTVATASAALTAASAASASAASGSATAASTSAAAASGSATSAATSASNAAASAAAAVAGNANASNLTTGTLPDGRFPGTLPAGVTVPAAQLSGNIATARLLAAFPGTKANPGHITLPNGLILQFGSTSVSAEANLNVTLPVTFPNAFLVAFATRNESNTALIGRAGAGIVSTSQIQLQNAGEATSSIFWFAIGH